MPLIGISQIAGKGATPMTSNMMTWVAVESVVICNSSGGGCLGSVQVQTHELGICFKAAV